MAVRHLVVQHTVVGWRVHYTSALDMECTHEVVFHGICGICGQDVTKDDTQGKERSGTAAQTKGADMVHSVGWGHNESGLKISRNVAKELSHKHDELRLLNSKRLALVVDLDKTVLHTTDRAGAAIAEQWARRGCDITELGMPHGRYFTRVRPGVDKFLTDLKEFYEMHVYTMGTRRYAKQVLKLIDPTQSYFGDRIISQDESFSKQRKTGNLDALFPNGYRLVAIIDDTQQVWDFSPNLVPIVPYEYFKGMDEANIVAGTLDETLEKQRSATKDDRAELVKSLSRTAGLTKILQTDYSNFAAIIGDAIVAEFRYCLETMPSKSATELGGEIVANLDSNSKGTATRMLDWINESLDSTSIDGLESKSNFDETEELESALQYIESIFSLFPEVSYLLDSEGIKLVLRSSNESKMIIGPDAMKLVLAHVECLSNSEINGNIVTTRICGAAAEAVRTKKVEQAYWLVKDRLYYRQFRAAVFLMKVFKHFIKSKYFNQDERTLLVHYLTEKKGQTKNGTTRLSIMPPPVTDGDKVLEKVGEILKALHEEFYSCYDKDNTKEAVPEVAKILQDKIKPIHTDYPCWALAGCNIVFSGIIPLKSDPSRNECWIKCRSMGARCDDKVSQRTTHLVARSTGSAKFRDAIALKTGIKIIKESWILDSFAQRKRLDEMMYLLQSRQDSEASAIDVDDDKNEQIEQMMHFDVTAVTEMDAEVDAAMESSSDEEDIPQQDSATSSDGHEEMDIARPLKRRRNSSSSNESNEDTNAKSSNCEDDSDDDDNEDIAFLQELQGTFGEQANDSNSESDS